jgi:hypothetical protein
VKRIVVVAVFVAVWLASLSGFAEKKNDSPTRLLAGQVTNQADAPLSNAVVYLKNIKTLGVKTYITDTDGKYRFPELSPDVDYQIHAEYNGAKSETKTLSSFDSRLRPTMNLKIEPNK